MSEQTEVNNEVGAVDIVGKINDNQREPTKILGKARKS